MRDLTEQERAIVTLCNRKYGASDRDEVFFTESDQAILQVWGSDGNGPWVNLSNLGLWLSDGLLSEQQIIDTQM